MKIEELRIGNLVFDPHTKVNCTVDAISLSGFVYTEDHTADDWQRTIEPEGILLTPEWLERLGWVWNEECNSYEKFPNGDSRMHLAKRMHSYTMFNYVLKAMICENIYYVNQLQNLYNALTGEELILKEEIIPKK